MATRPKSRDKSAAVRRRGRARPVYRPAFSDIRGLPAPNAKAPPPPSSPHEGLGWANEKVGRAPLSQLSLASPNLRPYPPSRFGGWVQGPLRLAHAFW